MAARNCRQCSSKSIDEISISWVHGAEAPENKAHGRFPFVFGYCTADEDCGGDDPLGGCRFFGNDTWHVSRVYVWASRLHMDAAPDRADLPGRLKVMDEAIEGIRNRDKIKNYAHFDLRVSFSSVQNEVTNSEFVKRHGFYPLIRREHRKIKWENGVPITDPRPISYAAHKDRCIYQYYASWLNIIYNEKVRDSGIDQSAIAYRTNKPGTSTCDFAERLFSYVRKSGPCWVLTGDFRHFFDTVDHQYLVEQVRTLFPGGMIPEDMFRVIRSAMRYSYIDIRDLLDYYGLPFSVSGIKRLNNKKCVMGPAHFRRFVKSKIHVPWREKGEIGIPQGLPISGVLANIHLMDFDTCLAAFAEAHGGIYMRYCDDFAIAILEGTASPRFLLDSLLGFVAGIPGLAIHSSKTKMFKYDNRGLCKVNMQTLEPFPAGGAQINYLGFSFDGRSVRLRQQTIGRFYRKTYRRVKTTFGRRRQPGKRKVELLYLQSSSRGKNPHGNAKVRAKLGYGNKHGNFHTYVERAQGVFPDDPISRDTKRRKRKIRARSEAVRRKVRRRKRRTCSGNCEW